MAYRNIDIDFWQDEYILNLTTDEKLFYLYLLTNGKTTQIGVYSLVYKVIKFETGYENEQIDKCMEKLSQDEKIKYDIDTKEIYINNWYRYNYINKSPKVMNYLWKEWTQIKSFEFKKLVLNNMLISFSHKKLLKEMEIISIQYPNFINTISTDERKQLDSICIPYQYPIYTLWEQYREQSKEESNQNQEIIIEEEQSMSEVPQEEQSSKNDYEEFTSKFNILVEKWNSSEMGINRPVKKTTSTMQSNCFRLLYKYDLDTILEVMQQLPTNRWYLGEIPNKNGDVFNISFTWFLELNNFEDTKNKLDL